MKRILAAAALTFAVSAPAVAAEFYIVQDTTSKRCTVVEQRPTSTTTVVVGGNRVYQTRTEAEGAIKEVCKDGMTGTTTTTTTTPR